MDYEESQSQADGAETLEAINPVFSDIYSRLVSAIQNVSLANERNHEEMKNELRLLEKALGLLKTQLGHMNETVDRMIEMLFKFTSNPNSLQLDFEESQNLSEDVQNCPVVKEEEIEDQITSSSDCKEDDSSNRNEDGFSSSNPGKGGRKRKEPQEPSPQKSRKPNVPSNLLELHPELRINRHIYDVESLVESWFITFPTSMLVIEKNKRYGNAWRKEKKDETYYFKRSPIIKFIMKVTDEEGPLAGEDIFLVAHFLQEIMVNNKLTLISLGSKITKDEFKKDITKSLLTKIDALANYNSDDNENDDENDS